MTSTTNEDANDKDLIHVDLASVSLEELLFGGDTVLDRAMQGVVADLNHEVFAAFGNVPRTI